MAALRTWCNSRDLRWRREKGFSRVAFCWARCVAGQIAKAGVLPWSPWSVRRRTQQFRGDRLEQDLCVQPQREILYIGKVMANPLQRLIGVDSRTAQPVALGPSRQPRPHFMAEIILRHQLFIGYACSQHAPDMWPWSHQRHVPSQHVDELRQFINTGPANKAANGRNTMIFGNGLGHGR